MIGRSLGPYKIVEQLGKGGMGEVWLAEDTRLGRKVAVKVLPAELAGDVDRRQRFEQEAKAAAALNHPHIAAIHDVGVETGDGPPTHYMVQEYLQGETLRDALSRGALAPDKAVGLGIEIAEALKAAHRAGIVHRDLKPENVFVTGDGHAKVLDFGLAKLTEAAFAPGSGPSMSPTVTMAGLVLGTAGYMAPEQVRGEEIDERADLFALGCVLYEMLAGKQAFGGGNVHESLSRILTGEPEPIGQVDGSTGQLGGLLDKLLAKERDQRFQCAADVVVDLRRVARMPAETDAEAAEEPAGPRQPVVATRRSPAALVAIAAIALALGAAGAWLAKPSPPTPAALDARFEVMLQQGQSFSANYNRVLTISPDGRTIAYMAGELWLRAIDETVPRPIRANPNARSPAFSHDSTQVAYWEAGHIKRARIDERVPIIVAPLHERPHGMNWADDGFIYIGRSDRGIWRVSGAGGEPEPVLSLSDGEYAHGPELLPGGEWMLFSLCHAVRAWSEGSIVAQSLKTDERRVLIPRGREVRYASSGHLTYVLDNTLFAVPFDAARVEVTGEAVALERNVHTSGEDETGAAGYDFSDDGVLVYAPPAGFGARGTSRLVFLDRDGKQSPLAAGARRFGVVSLSPDESRVAAQINDPEGTHIWIVSTESGGAQRLTTAGRNSSPVWSHDGRYVYFASNRDGDTDIWRRVADLSAPAEKVLAAEGAQFPTTVAADGRWLMFSWMVPGNSEIGRLRLGQADPSPELLVNGPADESNGRLSPDGRFFCFQSDETGGWEIHVMEIATGRRWIVSSTYSGFFPFWTRDGKQIQFAVGNGRLMSVDVTTDPEFTAGEPQLAFEVDPGVYGQGVLDVSRDGRRILIGAHEAPDESLETRPRMTVVLNWFDQLERRVGHGGG